MASRCPTANVPDHLVADWSTLVSMDQDFNFDESRRISSCNGIFQINQGQNSSVAGSVPSSTFGNDRLSQVNKSSDYSETTQFRSTSDFQLNSKHAIERNFKGKKRKNSPADDVHEIEAEHQTDVPSESANISVEQDNKQQKNQMNPSGTTQKPTARSTKGRSQECNAVNEDYIHIRAKRGQATNSHSLAERVRRERISERMRLLQDLVPGCNKITGKAMMLDEIINYVQSLQRQVEFLSMKLSAVNPEFNLDLEQILKKDTLHLREGGSHVGFAQGMGSFNPSMPGLSLQGLVGLETLCGISSESDMLRTSYLNAPNIAQLSSLWGDELQNMAHLGYIANATVGTEQHGPAKV